MQHSNSSGGGAAVTDPAGLDSNSAWPWFRTRTPAKRMVLIDRLLLAGNWECTFGDQKIALRL